MDAREVFHIRIRHALRAAAGGAAIAAIGLTTSVTAGCLTSVLFFVSTVAGTPENYQAFQLRAASLTLTGACLGSLAYAVTHAIAGTSAIAAFFTAVPFITFFASLRPDPSLGPLPPIAIAVLGILSISRVGQSRSTVPRTLGLSLLDAAIAYALAVLVSIIFPDRASDLGRRMVATELRQLGVHISRVASNTFSPSPKQTPSNEHMSLTLERSLQENAMSAGLLDGDYIFPTSASPGLFSSTAVELERNQSMIRSAEQSLNFLQQLRPFGWTRVSDYCNLARAEQLLAVSVYEPRILPSSKALWRNATAWAQLVEALTVLVTKVSSLESVSYTGDAGPSRFSQSNLLNLFGEAYFPLWVSHYASCATACAAMSLAISHATCKDMFYLPGEDQQGVRGSCPLDGTIDPRKWKRRRAQMYYGFLLRYRARIRNGRNGGLAMSHTSSVTDLRTLESGEAGVSNTTMTRRLGSQRSPQSKPLKGPRVMSENGSSQEMNREHSLHKEKLPRGSLAELQALSFFGVASHSLSEEIGHVQSAMVALAASSEERSILSPVFFVTAGLPILWKRIRQVVTGDVLPWEVRFICSHSLLLITILALSLFLPLNFEASEIAWVFTSAALAAQLSAEPTLFIGAIRVFATITGAALAFGFTSILDAAGRSSRPGLQYLMIPYIFVVTMGFLLLIPPSLRYAAFLVTLTNAIILFCPRSTPECAEVLKNQSEECFPNWQFVISRSVNVSIGVAFALFFHLFFWPRFANQEAFRSLSKAFINAARMLGRLRRTYFTYGLGRSEWLRQDTDPEKARDTKIGSGEERMSLDGISSFQGDLYHKDKVMLDALRKDLSSHVSRAMLTVRAEAGLWKAGPFRLSPLLPPILSEFIALDISLTELAALLGRKPIFSESYGRSAHDHFINPLLPYYETIQISLINLVGVIDRIFEDRGNRALRENSLDLYQSIAHLARMRSELRRDAEVRAKLFEEKDFAPLQVRKRLCSWSQMDDFDRGVFEENGESSQDEFAKDIQRRRRSTDDVYQLRQSNNISVDDIVLYNTFAFIADGCLSAFVRIAITVLTDAESKLKRTKDRSKAKEK